jgi:hypothetical protein
MKQRDVRQSCAGGAETTAHVVVFHATIETPILQKGIACRGSMV